MVCNQKYKVDKQIHPDVMYLLEQYDWPGNVRELENMIENLVIMSQGDTIVREELPSKFFGNRSGETLISFQETIPLKDAVDQVEQELIHKAMEKYGSARKAAPPWASIPPPLFVSFRADRKPGADGTSFRTRVTVAKAQQ